MPVVNPTPSDLPVRAEPLPFFGNHFHPLSLISRIFSLAFLFAVELVVISVLLDSASLNGSGGLLGLIRSWGPWVLRGIVGGAAIFATFLWLKHQAALDRISAELEHQPIAWPLLGVHAVAMVGFAALSFRLYWGGVSAGGSFFSPPNLLAAGWLLAGAAAIAFASLATLPWGQWVRLIGSGGTLWAYALVSTVLACIAGNFSRALWQPAAQLTFTLSKWILTPLVSGLIVNPSLPALGTSRFRVIVAPECSGLEGAGLILAFGIVWLLLFRHECRFPQSLLLIPASVVVLFLLNAVRIAALLLIGDAGAPQIAAGGFHSQAGWILFNAVAVGFCVTVRNVAWFTTRPVEIQPAAAVQPVEHAAEHIGENPTAAYLVPFLAILAAGMIATAASGPFEWLYPLKLFAAAIALWMFRRQYAALDWRPSWLAVAAGAAVFGVWIALDRLLGTGAAASVPLALASASPVARTTWIALRATAAIATVPVAEELAFRGFLMRRLTSAYLQTADFETVRFQSVGWFALIVSAVVFGLLHGGQRIAGIAAGIVFGFLVKRRGSMGDAVAAHAVANALLAAYILIYGQWQLW